MQINGQATSYEIVTVFAERCYRLARQFNLTTTESFSEALATAKIRDQET